ncbi:hypothetical protein [Flavobacterium aurantiibacter]|uniref:Uncharacterized protein n=1 Tax=Flavobacterium aurantiibacter TaxID=2023067 RepID=A0A255ZLE1_9FLAO|nr:hypothetical protein [Flavobacterium aurantiibacter]OYQ42232.1 hypothetical protein CHX27_12065 [Flavobacterium aurantiibacter]
MKKIVWALFLTTAVWSQQIVKTFNVKLEKKTGVFHVIEEQKKQIALFFTDKKSVRALRLDDNFQFIDSINAARIDKKYDAIIGSSVSDNRYYVYWSTPNNKEIVAQCFDFGTKQTSEKAHKFGFSEERLFKKITVNNIFYLITATKNESILNLYAFADGNVTKKSIDLSNIAFINEEMKRTKLWDILSAQTDIDFPFAVQNILNETPPSLAFSASKRKVYVKDNTLIFVFDTNQSFSQMLRIDLNDFSVSQTAFQQPFLIETELGYNDSNSFLVDDKLIQMKINSEKMKISVKNMDKTELKLIELTDEQEIDFKNSPIIQENGNIKNTRVLETSNQLLRKIYNTNPSISCYSFNDKIYLTLGGVSVNTANNGVATGVLIGGLAGGLIAAALSSNYSVDNLDSYANRKIMYINCVFDKNFNHIEGDIIRLPFDRLRKFAFENEKLTARSIFQINKQLFFGGYDNENQTYSFYRFSNSL